MTQEPSPVRSSPVATPLSSTVAVHRSQDQRRRQEFANKKRQAQPAVEIDEESEQATPAAPAEDDTSDKHEVDFLA